MHASCTYAWKTDKESWPTNEVKKCKEQGQDEQREEYKSSKEAQGVASYC